MDKVQGDKPRIRWAHWTWLLLTISFLFFRLQNIQGVFTRDGVIINDTDPYYRLHRIESMVKTGNAYPLNEKNLNYPNGLDVPWPTGLDILISIPLKLYNSTSRAEIESFGAIIIPFLALPLLWFSGWVGSNMGGILVGILMGLFITCSSTLIYQSGLGRLDHHFIEAMLPMMLLMFMHRYFQKKERYLTIGMVLILGLAPAFVAQGWIIAPLMISGLLLGKKWGELHNFSKILLASFGVNVFVLAFSDRFLAGNIRWDSFSWWSPWIYICGSFLLEMTHIWLHPKERNLKPFPILLKILLLTVLFFLIYKNSAGYFTDNLSQSFRYVVEKHGTMGMTLEARSPFQLNFDQLVHSDIHILILSSLGMIYFLITGSHRFLMGYALIPILFSFLQIRFMAMGLPLMFLILLLFMKEWIEKIWMSNWKRGVVFILTSFVLIIPFKPYFGFTLIENTHFYFRPVRSFCFFLNQEYKRNHRPKGQDAIIAHWDYGHWLLYYTGLPVVANPFQGQTAYEVLELFTSKGNKQLDLFTQQYPSKYLVMEAGAQRTLGWLQAVGKNKELYFEKVGEIEGQDHFQTTPIYEDLFMYRFFFELGRGLDNNHPQNWRLIYSSPYSLPYDKEIPALKAFEKVAGLSIELHTKKPYKKLYLQADIMEKSELFLFQQTSIGPHDFNWTVPYGKYDAGSVAFDGTYVIRNEDGKILHTIKDVSENQVLRGDTLKIQF